MKNNTLKTYSQNLRKGQTREERHLWYDFLNTLPQQFHRQYVILDYIVDFCCPTKKIIIELDGVQHYWDNAQEKDEARDKALEELGFTVMRFTNKQIHRDFKNVCFAISARLGLV